MKKLIFILMIFITLGVKAQSDSTCNDIAPVEVVETDSTATSQDTIHYSEWELAEMESMKPRKKGFFQFLLSILFH